MNINFPNNPVMNQVFIVGSKKWKWNGIAWNEFLTFESIDGLPEVVEQVQADSSEAKQTATQALEDAATADGKAVAAQEMASTNSGRLNTLETLTVENFSESYQLQATDSNKLKRCTSAVDVNLTIPADLSLPLPVAIEQAGNGVVTVVAGAGVTVNGDAKTAGQNTFLKIIKVDENTYTLSSSSGGNTTLIAEVEVTEGIDGQYVDFTDLGLTQGDELLILQYKNSGDNVNSASCLITFNDNKEANIIMSIGTVPSSVFYGGGLHCRYYSLSTYKLMNNDIVQETFSWVRASGADWSGITRGTYYGYSFGGSYPTVNKVSIRTNVNGVIKLFKRKY